MTKVPADRPLITAEDVARSRESWESIIADYGGVLRKVEIEDVVNDETLLKYANGGNEHVADIS